jgi:hypothetical protein
MQQTGIDVTGFLTIMAALSASTQTLVENLLKKHWPWLDQPKTKDNRRQAAIHMIAGVVGGVLVWTMNLHPLQYLGVASMGMFGNALAAGVLVSYGGSLFDEGLGALRAYKKAQASLQAPRAT